MKTTVKLDATMTIEQARGVLAVKRPPVSLPQLVGASIAAYLAVIPALDAVGNWWRLCNANNYWRARREIAEGVLANAAALDVEPVTGEERADPVDAGAHVVLVPPDEPLDLADDGA